MINLDALSYSDIVNEIDTDQNAGLKKIFDLDTAIKQFENERQRLQKEADAAALHVRMCEKAVEHVCHHLKLKVPFTTVMKDDTVYDVNEDYTVKVRKAIKVK